MAKELALLPHIDGPQAFTDAFGVSRETADRLVIYAQLLEKWQRTINLVAPGTLSDIWHRHLADSAQVFALVRDRGETWIDLGSGAGFPGLVLAIMRADFGAGRVVLVESDSRKCAFLAEIVRQTRLGGAMHVEILNQRIEIPSTQAKIGHADVVSARALAPLERLLALAEPLFGAETLGVFPKGRGAKAELADAQKLWDFEVEAVASRTEAEGTIYCVRGLRRTAKEG